MKTSYYSEVDKKSGQSVRIDFDNVEMSYVVTVTARNKNGEEKKLSETFKTSYPPIHGMDAADNIKGRRIAISLMNEIILSAG